MKRVFIFSNPSLFGQGLEGLLCRESELDVLGWETDLEKAIRRVKEIRPGVVILAGEEARTDSTAAVMQILKESRGTLVVEVDLESRILHVYGEGHRLVREVEALMDVIQYPAACGTAGLDESGQAATGAEPGAGGESREEGA